ncbi:hypothetical protein IWX78_003234 [Mycetocola sp. CAN_C7]|uniref:hypothetical protein n=1 Tax=Mycetocola sp. CAN_C7 TaxID=2787724 RepID=UPI0018C99A96
MAKVSNPDETTKTPPADGSPDPATDAPQTDEGGDGDSGPPKKSADTPTEPGVLLRALIAATVASALAVLAAIGIQGELLQRLIRNDPRGFVIALSLTLIGALISLVALIWHASFGRVWTRVGETFGAIVVIVGIILLLALGTTSIGSSETPALTFSAAYTDKDTVRVTAKAEATGLLLRESMVLKITVVKPGTDPSEGGNAICENSAKPRPSTTETHEVIYWGEKGTTSQGKTEALVEIDISPADIKYVCAAVFLRLLPKDSAQVTEGRLPLEPAARSVRATIDIERLAIPPTPTPQPAAVPFQPSTLPDTP